MSLIFSGVSENEFFFLNIIFFLYLNYNYFYYLSLENK